MRALFPPREHLFPKVQPCALMPIPSARNPGWSCERSALLLVLAAATATVLAGALLGTLLGLIGVAATAVWARVRRAWRSIL
jgi:hypothetical protein